MPNIITHTLFADEILDEIAPVFEFNRQLFEIGANGPDVLFFHKVNPRTPFARTPLRKIGSYLHSGHVNAFYESALRSIRREKDPQIKEDMIAYTAGHLCHWALDSTVHPYIFYRTGNCKKESAARHHRFESILDSLMLKYKKNQTIQDFDITKKVTSATPEQARAMARIYVPAIEDIFARKIRPSMIMESLQDWNTMQKIFRDPSGRKIKGFQKVEKILGKDNLFSGYGVPPVPEDNYDIMNLLHEPWYHPITEEESTDSVLELYDKAKIRALEAIRLFLEAVANRDEESAFLHYIDDQNYDMGLRNDINMHCFKITDLSI